MSQIFQHVSDADVVHILAFIGGFVDAGGYVKIPGVFTSSITGNLVVACSSFVHIQGVVCRSCVCVSFVLAGSLGAFAALRLRSYHKLPPRHLSLILFSLQLIMFVIVWAVGIRIDGDIESSGTNVDHWPFVLAGSLMGASMGFQSVAAKETIANCPPTTVMTSTLINVSGNFSNTLGYFLAEHSIMPLAPAAPKSHLTSQEKTSYDDKYRDSRGKFFTTAKPLLSFIVGALIGAVTMHYGTFHCIAIPLFLVVFIMAQILIKDLAESSKAAAAAAANNNNQELSPKQLDKQTNNDHASSSSSSNDIVISLIPTIPSPNSPHGEESKSGDNLAASKV